MLSGNLSFDELRTVTSAPSSPLLPAAIAWDRGAALRNHSLARAFPGRLSVSSAEVEFAPCASVCKLH